MVRASKLSARSCGLALIAVALVAIVVAGIAVWFTPTDYCAELPTPAGRETTIFGLGVAFVAVTAGLLIALSSRLALLLSLCALAAGIAVVLVGQARIDAWACG